MNTYSDTNTAQTTLSNYEVRNREERLYYVTKLPFRVEVVLRNSFGTKTVTKEFVNCVDNSHVTGWSCFRDNDDIEFGIADYKVAVAVNNTVKIISIGLSYYSKEVKMTTKMGEYYYDIVAIDGHDPIEWFAPHLKHLGLSK